MDSKRSLARWTIHVLLTCMVAGLASAKTVNFENEAMDRGGNLTGIPDSPLRIGIVTISGGELLKGETGLVADRSGVYATEGSFGSGETNPILISFAKPVKSFSILVANGEDLGAYAVSDNFGETVQKRLSPAGSGGAYLFTLQGVGLSGVTITSADVNAWSFAIDDISFDEMVAVPEPGMRVLLGAGFLLLLIVRRVVHLRTRE